jgi:intracellular sulfur oxidation DsrE/DsrF family protein
MSSSPRRGFLRTLLGGAAALAGAPLLDGSARAQGVASAGAEQPRGAWDMSWVDRITGRHRQVFDAPSMAEGTVLHQARMFMAGFGEVYGARDADTIAVLVIRHEAIPMVLNDAAWARYADVIRKWAKLKDPTTGKDARRNPFIGVKPDDKYSLVWPDGGLDKLIARGATVLACNMALGGFAGIAAEKTKQKQEDVQAELKASLVPGVILMPSGIFAVTRAEEAGCNYISSNA